MSLSTTILSLIDLASRMPAGNLAPVLAQLAHQHTIAAWHCKGKGSLLTLRDDSHLLIREDPAGLLFEAANDEEALGTIMTKWFAEDPEVERQFMLEVVEAIAKAAAPPGFGVHVGYLSDEEARVLIDAGYLPPGEVGEYTGPGCPKQTARRLMAKREEEASAVLDRIFDRSPELKDAADDLVELLDMLFSDKPRPH